jgi:tetratricopeptide (TPR) repeat protein
MIGIIQVGGQAMADRYTYLPTIGLVIGMVWSIDQIARQQRLPTTLPIAAGILTISLLAGLTWQQVARWRNGFTLYSHAYQVSPENYMALTKIGDTLLQDKRWREAIPYYTRSLRIDRTQKEAHNNLAICLKLQGKLDQAEQHLYMATALDDKYLEAFFNLGNLKTQKGEHQAAAIAFSRVLALQPDDAGAHYNLAKSYLALKRFPEAIKHLETALALIPDIEDANQLLHQVQRDVSKH